MTKPVLEVPYETGNEEFFDAFLARLRSDGLYKSDLLYVPCVSGDEGLARLLRNGTDRREEDCPPGEDQELALVTETDGLKWVDVVNAVTESQLREEIRTASTGLIVSRLPPETGRDFIAVYDGNGFEHLTFDYYRFKAPDQKEDSLVCAVVAES